MTPLFSNGPSGFVPTRLDGTALRGLQECAAGHGVSRQSTAGSVAGLVEPRLTPQNKKKISNLSGMDSDPKSPFQKKSISISISISKNIQISQISNPRSSTASRGRNMWIFWRLGIPRVPWTPKLSDLPRWVILGWFLDHDLAGFLCHDPEAAIKISSYWYI